MAIGIGVDWLAAEFATVGERLAVSAAVVVALAGLGWLARRAQDRLDLGVWDRALNAGFALATAGVVLAALTALLALWEVSVFALLDIQKPVVLLTRLVFTVVLLVGTYLLTGFVKEFVFEFAEDRSAVTRHQTELIFRVTQVSVYALAVIVVFGVWNVNIGGLLVGAGFLGIVVGLAARQTLGALLAGFVLMFSRPFEIGDWVEIGDRDGIVTEITIVNTRIQTFDGEYVMLPNDVVGSSEIVNRTRKGRLRIHVEVGIDYDEDVERAVDVATEAMRDLDDVLSVPQPQAVVTEFGASSIVLDLRFWIDKPSARRRWRAQTAVISAVKGAFDREGIKIPFPQRELSGRAETGGFRVAAEGAPGAETDAADGGE